MFRPVCRASKVCSSDEINGQSGPKDGSWPAPRLLSTRARFFSTTVLVLKILEKQLQRQRLSTHNKTDKKKILFKEFTLIIIYVYGN